MLLNPADFAFGIFLAYLGLTQGSLERPLVGIPVSENGKIVELEIAFLSMSNLANPSDRKEVDGAIFHMSACLLCGNRQLRCKLAFLFLLHSFGTFKAKRCAFVRTIARDRVECVLPMGPYENLRFSLRSA